MLDTKVRQIQKIRFKLTNKHRITFKKIINIKNKNKRNKKDHKETKIENNTIKSLTINKVKMLQNLKRKMKLYLRLGKKNNISKRKQITNIKQIMKKENNKDQDIPKMMMIFSKSLERNKKKMQNNKY